MLPIVTSVADGFERAGAGERVVLVVDPASSGEVGDRLDPADSQVMLAASEMAAEMGARSGVVSATSVEARGVEGDADAG